MLGNGARRSPPTPIPTSARCRCMPWTPPAEYCNPDGAFVITKDGKRKKTFHQRRPDPERQGKWIWNVDGVPIVPYRLPELPEAIGNGYFVVIAEGEGKVE